MNITFYILPSKVGVKFVTTPERDGFYNSIPAPIQPIAEKVGALTIRFHPEKLAVGGYSVMMEAAAVQAPSTPSASTLTNPIGGGGLVDISKTPNPFTITGEHAVKALPGLVAVQSNIPPEQQPAEKVLVESRAQPVQSAPTPVVEAPKAEAPVANDDPEPTNIHKNSRKYREWKARQK